MEKLKYLVSRVLEVPESSIGPEMSSENTPSWDAVGHILLTVELERAYNLKLTADETMGIKTFADVVKLLTSKGVEPRE